MNSYADCMHTKSISGPPCIHDAHAEGYASALRDAVEAVAADSEFDDVRDQWHAVEVIEALQTPTATHGHEPE